MIFMDEDPLTLLQGLGTELDTKVGPEDSNKFRSIMTDFGDYPGIESCNRVNTEMAKTAYRDPVLKRDPTR